MSCSDPPPLSDEAITASLNGDTLPPVRQHLQHCGGCAAYMEQTSQFERTLFSYLHRWDCPPAAQLGDYHLGLLPHDQQRTLARHLALCVRCKAEVEELQRFLTMDTLGTTPPATPARFPDRRRTLVARLLPNGPMLQLAGGRYAGDGLQIAQCTGATIVLEARRGEREILTLMGQIADEAGDQDRWNGALVEVRQAGVLIGTAFIDDVGSFVCSPVATSVTELRITGADGRSIVIEEIML